MCIFQTFVGVDDDLSLRLACFNSFIHFLNELI
jgi:hypothetical protein